MKNSSRRVFADSTLRHRSRRPIHRRASRRHREHTQCDLALLQPCTAAFSAGSRDQPRAVYRKQSLKVLNRKPSDSSGWFNALRALSLTSFRARCSEPFEQNVDHHCDVDSGITLWHTGRYSRHQKHIIARGDSVTRYLHTRIARTSRRNRYPPPCERLGLGNMP